MVTQDANVYLWGFPPGQPGALPTWLLARPATTADLPVRGTLLVFEPAAPTFIAAMRDRPGAATRDQQAILYATGAGAPLPDAWLYFADTVEAGDWPTLRALIACPQQSTTAQLALDLPAAQIEEVLALLTTASYAPGALDSLLPETTPGPERVAHLATCETCRRALAVALQARREWTTTVFCPPATVLATYAYGEGRPDPVLAMHLAGCPACAAEVAVLRTLDQAVVATIRLPATLPVPAPPGLAPGSPPVAASRPPWLKLELGGLTAQRGAPLTEGLAAARAVTQTFVTGLLQPPLRLQPLTAGAHLGRTDAAGAGPGAFAQTGAWVLISPVHELTVGWDPDAGQIWLTDLRDDAGEPIPEFQVTLWAGDRELWSGASDAGRVVIPTAAVAAAITLADGTLSIAVPGSPESIGGTR